MPESMWLFIKGYQMIEFTVILTIEEVSDVDESACILVESMNQNDRLSAKHSKFSLKYDVK
jgi:hypothetical protein